MLIEYFLFACCISLQFILGYAIALIIKDRDKLECPIGVLFGVFWVLILTIEFVLGGTIV